MKYNGDECLQLSTILIGIKGLSIFVFPKNMARTAKIQFNRMVNQMLFENICLTNNHPFTSEFVESVKDKKLTAMEVSMFNKFGNISN